MEYERRNHKRLPFSLLVLKVSNRGGLAFPALWPFAEGLFILYEIIFQKKKDFKFIYGIIEL
jgi:hypothetical protein